MTEEIGFRNVALTVNTAATTPATTTVAPNRLGNRKSIYLRNASTGGAIAAVITVFFDNLQAPTTLGGGYILGPGGYIIDSNSEQYACWQGTIRAVSDTDGATIVIAERC